MLLIGGDFTKAASTCRLSWLPWAQVKTLLGTYAVLGNNDYEACYDDIVREMRHYGMHLLEHKVDTLRAWRRADSCGGRQLFDSGQERHIAHTRPSPDDFVILLTHTPDYAEDVPVTNSDLIRPDTHGGQVTLPGFMH